MPQTPHIERHFTAGLAEIAAGSIATGLGGYLAGGFIPLAPCLLAPSARAALALSVVVTLVALTVLGFVKGHFTGAKPARSALQTALIGGLAASAAFGIARAIG